MKARFSGKAALAAAALSLGLLPSLAEAQVFRAAGDSLSLERHQQLQADPLVVPDRWRVARFDRSEIARASGFKMPLVLNLFNDVEVRGHIAKTKSLEGGASFTSGSLEGGGHFSIFLHGSGIVRGEIHSRHGTYTMKSEGEGYDQVLIKQQDVSKLPGCGNEELESTARPLGPLGHAGARPGGWSRQAGWPQGMPSDGSDEGTSKTIDMLVLYTQNAENYEGGPEQIKAVIENEMAKMNLILDNSGLSHRQMRLAGMEKVDNEYAVPTSQRRGDIRSKILALMEKHQADMHHILADLNKLPEGSYYRGKCGFAGLGYVMGQEYYIQRNCEGNELCVQYARRETWRNALGATTSIRCLSSFTFAHETGHGLGMFHDRGEDYTITERAGPWKNYSFGYVEPRHYSFGEDCRRRTTIMARSAGADVPYFSNPDLFFPPLTGYQGCLDFPMGKPGDERNAHRNGPANASRAIDESWDIVASLSEVVEEERPVCNEGDISADALSSLPDEVALPARGGETQIAVSFSEPEQCWRVDLQSSSSLSAFSTSVEKVQQGEWRLSIGAGPHEGACGSGPITAEVAVALRGAPGVSPKTISVEQGFQNEFCGGLSDASEEAVSLDLSGRNPYSGFRLSSGMFAGFPRLEDLNLSDNLLDHFQNSYFDGLNLLKRLDLSGNELTELEDAAFAHLPELEHLNLQGNKLRRIKDSYFDKAVWERDAARYRALRTLDLSHNELKELDERSFRHFEYLESLQLNDNQLEAIDKDSFLGPSGLKQLNLARNSIEAVARSAFIFTTELTHLNLSSNRIASLSDGTFGRVWHDGTVNALEDLRQLNLSRNRLEEFPELSMNGKLTHLWLGWNRIASVGDGLSEQAELTGLQLSSNRLAEFPDLSGNGKLTRLWLGGNAIAAVGDGLSHLPELTALQLSRNQLEEMPDLSNNRKLTHLWLEGNKVASIPPRAFAGLSELRYLNISDNPLTEPLPRAVCTFIRGVKTVVAEGIDMSVVCPQ